MRWTRWLARRKKAPPMATEDPFRMTEADNLTDADRAKLLDLFGLSVDLKGEIAGLTTHPEFAFFVAMHSDGAMTARLKVAPGLAASMLRQIADIIELESKLKES